MAQQKEQPPTAGAGPAAAAQARPNLLTAAAFAALVGFVGANVVAVRVINLELSPFWAAGTRFVAASTLFFLYAWNRRLPLPRGRALGGVLLFGTLQFGVGFALIYWALQSLPAGLASVILALVPLFTLFFAFLARLEPLRPRGVAGALIAAAGVAVMTGGRIGNDVSLPHLLAAVATAASFALAVVVVKSQPQVHPAVTNAVAMLTGALILLALSFAAGEVKAVPQEAASWAAYLYLAFPGTIGLFGLLLYVLRRWTATGVSYQAVLSPIVATALSAWLLDEPLTGGLFLGGLLVCAGVFTGAIAGLRSR